MLPQVFVVRLQQQRDGGGAFDVAAYLDELPAFAVAHGGVADALKLVNPLHDLLQEFGGLIGAVDSRLRVHVRPDLRPRDLQIKAVQPVPLLGGDLLADVAGVFPRGDDAGEDRPFQPGIEREPLGEFVGIVGPLYFLGAAQLHQQALPAAVRTGRALVQHQAQIHVKQARGVLRALDVAAHPVQAVGNAAQHWQVSYWLSTHVSLLPPPCEEFTTREPCFSATRVSPPGTMVTLSP